MTHFFDWVGLIILLILLGLVIWLVVIATSKPTASDFKFFATDPAAEDFMAAYFDWKHNQVTLLGEEIPIQTVNVARNGDIAEFEFKTKAQGQGTGVWENGTIDMGIGDRRFVLQTRSPKDLLQNVAGLYDEQQRQRAFHLS